MHTHANMDADRRWGPLIVLVCPQCHTETFFELVSYDNPGAPAVDTSWHLQCPRCRYSEPLRPADCAHIESLKTLATRSATQDLSPAEVSQRVDEMTLAGVRSIQAVTDQWECRSCGEPVPVTFACCWKCGAPAPADQPLLSPTEQTAPEDGALEVILGQQDVQIETDPPEPDQS